MADTSLAQHWLEGKSTAWRLQILQHRDRYAKDGTLIKSLPVRIRRFLNGTPIGMIGPVLEYLAKSGPYKSPIFNNETGYDADALYRPVSTAITKDGAANTGNTKDATYTIIQDLRLVDDETDSLDTISEESCSSITETSYYWDEPTVIAEVGNEQGIVWRVTGVSRDSETDLFSYQVSKTSAITQHVEETIASCNDQQKVSVETWDNLYGTPEAPLCATWNKDSIEKTTLVLPESCDHAQGISIQYEWQENPDCTLKCRITKTTAVMDVKQSSSRDELYEARESVQTINESATADSVDVNDGVITEVTSEKNPDGTYNNQVSTQTEKAVEDARVSQHVTVRGMTTEVAKRNVKDAGDDLTASDVGKTHIVERTPGDRYNVTDTVTTPNPKDSGLECAKTIFEHQHTEIRTQKESAGEAADAGGGKTRQTTSRQGDDGLWEVHEEVTTEIEQKSAQHSKQKTLRGVTETTVDRNVSNSDVTVAHIGDRVVVEKTPGGLYNRTVTRLMKEDVGQIGSNCQQTVFEHQHQTTENVANKPSEEASTAGSGKTYQKAARETEEGTWDVTETTTTEIAQPYAQHSKQKTLRGVTETTVDRNVSNSDVTVVNIGDRVVVEKTPGGLYNRTVTTLMKENVGQIGESCANSTAVSRSSSTENVFSKPDTKKAKSFVNSEQSITARRTEEGTWDVETVNIGYNEIVGIINGGATNATTKTTVKRNSRVQTASEQPSKNKTVSVSITPNDHGSYDKSETVTTYTTNTVTATSNMPMLKTTAVTTINNTNLNPSSDAASGQPNDHGSATTTTVTYTPKPYNSGWQTWDSETKGPNYTYKYHHGICVFKNQDTIPTPKGQNVSVHITVNQFGKLDGSISYSDMYSYVVNTGGGGSGGGITTGTATFERYDAARAKWITYKVSTVTYTGVGNEGSERSHRANQYIIDGLHLGNRTYATSAPVPLAS